MENEDDEDACMFIAWGHHDKQRNGFVLYMLELLVFVEEELIV